MSARIVILSVVTLGLYVFVWLHRAMLDAAAACGKKARAALVAWSFAITHIIVVGANVALLALIAAGVFVGTGQEPSDAWVVWVLVLSFAPIPFYFIGMALAAYSFWRTAAWVEEALAKQGKQPAMPAVLHGVLAAIVPPWAIVAAAVLDKDMRHLR